MIEAVCHGGGSVSCDKWMFIMEYYGGVALRGDGVVAFGEGEGHCIGGAVDIGVADSYVAVFIADLSIAEF